MGMLLEDENTGVYEGGKKVGGAVRGALAGVEARIFLGGSIGEMFEEVTEGIRFVVGVSETVRTDAFYERRGEGNGSA